MKEIVKTFKKLSENDFYEQFTPTINHLVHDAPFGGTMYETYGPELEHINKMAESEFKNKIWTIEEVEGKMYYVSGWHFVNRFGYIITEEDVPEDIQIEVMLDTEINTAKFVRESTEIDPDTKGEVQLSVFKHNESGGMFAIDSSYLEQKFEDDDNPMIPDPFNEGAMVQLEGI